jgi:hypothetical protein
MKNWIFRPFMADGNTRKNGACVCSGGGVCHTFAVSTNPVVCFETISSFPDIRSCVLLAAMV